MKAGSTGEITLQLALVLQQPCLVWQCLHQLMVLSKPSWLYLTRLQRTAEISEALIPGLTIDATNVWLEFYPQEQHPQAVVLVFPALPGAKEELGFPGAAPALQGQEKEPRLLLCALCSTCVQQGNSVTLPAPAAGEVSASSWESQYL